METPVPNMGNAHFLKPVKPVDLYVRWKLSSQCLLLQTYNKVFLSLSFQHKIFSFTYESIKNGPHIRRFSSNTFVSVRLFLSLNWRTSLVQALVQTLYF
jgi:hypothetical protein